MKKLLVEEKDAQTEFIYHGGRKVITHSVTLSALKEFILKNQDCEVLVMNEKLYWECDRLMGEQFTSCMGRTLEVVGMPEAVGKRLGLVTKANV